MRIPESDDDPAIADVEAYLALSHSVNREARGDDAVPSTPAQVLPRWRDQSEATRVFRCADIDGTIAGVGAVEWPTVAAGAAAFLEVLVAEESRRQGIGTALLCDVERAASDAGRTVLLGGTQHLPRLGETVTPATGRGGVPLDGSSSFALANGYRLEQCSRRSGLDVAAALPVARRLLSDAQAVAGADYRFVFWETPTPTSELDQYAGLIDRIVDEIPLGDLQVEDTPWDADRVARTEQDDADAGLRRFVGAVRHVPSGRLVAFSDVQTSTSHAALGFQGATLVLPEHRGRRLGLLAKCAALQEIRRLVPELERIVTTNAEENAPMIAVNNAMGFRARVMTGSWQKRVG